MITAWQWISWSRRDPWPTARQTCCSPRTELAELGLFSRERQALLTDVALRTVVEPKLSALGLLR